MIETRESVEKAAPVAHAASAEHPPRTDANDNAAIRGALAGAPNQDGVRPSVSAASASILNGRLAHPRTRSLLALRARSAVINRALAIQSRRWLRRTLLALLYAPTLALLLVGLLAALGWLGGLWHLVSLLVAHQLGQFGSGYTRLDLAGRLGLLSASYLILLCALVVVSVGIRGRRWWRLYLVPGVPLSAAAAIVFLLAAAAVQSRLGLPDGLWQLLAGLALADAVVVGARIGGIGAGPLGTRRQRLRRRLRPVRDVPAARRRTTDPLPVIRFGPRVSSPPAVSVVSANDEAPVARGLPTAEDLRTGTVLADAQSAAAAATAEEEEETADSAAGE